MNEGKEFIRNKDILPVLHFRKHTSVVTKLFQHNNGLFLQSVPKSIFILPIFIKDSNHTMIMHDLLGL